jgi:hypothetical protein
MIKEITTYTKNLLGTSWVIGVNLFAGEIPAGVDDDCLAMIESGGAPNFYLPDRMDKAVQVISRAKDYHDAMDAAIAVYRALHGKAGITLPALADGDNREYLVNTIAAISIPQSLGRDEKGLLNISTNYVFKLQAA